eukprot:3061769-Rhodomonas_salina.1
MSHPPYPPAPSKLGRLRLGTLPPNRYLTERRLLPLSCAHTSTSIGHGATFSDAVCGTEIGYVAAFLLRTLHYCDRLWCYDSPPRCAVLSYAMQQSQGLPGSFNGRVRRSAGLSEGARQAVGGPLQQDDAWRGPEGGEGRLLPLQGARRDLGPTATGWRKSEELRVEGWREQRAIVEAMWGGGGQHGEGRGGKRRGDGEEG